MADKQKSSAEIQRTLFGAEAVERTQSIDPDAFGSFLAIHGGTSAFEAIWARPGLDLRSRSMITMALLVAANAPAQLRLHINGALNLGITAREIEELMYQCIPYLGYPRASDGLAVAREVIETRGLLER